MNNSGADLLLSMMCFGLVINTFLCAPIGGLIGHLAKGRWREGAGLGFLIGPLGWLLILAFADKKRRCQDCRGVVPAGAVKCLHCGANLSNGAKGQGGATVAPSPATAPVKARQPPAVKPQADKQFKCAKCNIPVIEEVELGESIFVCPQCGSRWQTK